jgi:glycosyltransferase involved in cell wall biosynthesis
MKIAYFSNSDFSLCNFRFGLMKRMKREGFQVFACSPITDGKYIQRIKKEGFAFVNTPLKRTFDFRGGDLLYFLKVFSLCRKEKFALCHNFTIKPCVYAPFAQKLAGIRKIYCTITGLGYIFEKRGFLRSIVVLLYRFSLKFADKIIFQNPDDQELFLGLNIVKKDKTALIKSSGININEFSPSNIDKKKQDELKEKIVYGENKITIILICRMLWQKGVGEFVKSAEILKKKYDNLQFLLIGPIDKGNPSYIAEKTLKNWDNKGVIKYLGERDDIKEVLSLTDIFVFPSYYKEGVPKVLLEAGIMGKPLITTNVAGCREAVVHNINGFLVEPRNIKDLAERLEILIRDKNLRENFGKASKQKMQAEFNEEKVVDETLKIYQFND